MQDFTNKLRETFPKMTSEEVNEITKTIEKLQENIQKTILTAMIRGAVATIREAREHREGDDHF